MNAKVVQNSNLSWALVVAVCLLSTTTVQAQATVCNSELWTDVKGKCDKFDSCVVLTDAVDEYRTCKAYCAAQESGLICVEAWEDESDESCDKELVATCETDFQTEVKTSDMVCRCQSEVAGTCGANFDCAGELTNKQPKAVGTVTADTQGTAAECCEAPTAVAGTCGANFDCAGEDTNKQPKADGTVTADTRGTAAECCEAPTAASKATCNGQPATKGKFKLSHPDVNSNNWCIGLEGKLGSCDDAPEFVWCCNQFRLASDETQCLVSEGCDKKYRVSVDSCSSLGVVTEFQFLGDYAEKKATYKVHLKDCADISLDVWDTEELGAQVGTYTSKGSTKGKYFQGDHLAGGSVCYASLCDNLDCGPNGNCNLEGSCTCKQGYTGPLCATGGAANCFDEKMNGDETGPDCGGSCDPCLKFKWKTGDFGDCSKSCGGGEKIRTVQCVDDAGADAPKASCDALGHEAESKEMCNDDPCNSYTYTTTDFGDCSVPCGMGIRTRIVGCQSSMANDAVPVSLCETTSNPKPSSEESCTLKAECEAPHWEVTWGTCDKACGKGLQTATFQCLKATKELGIDSDCTAAKPKSEQDCNLGPCGESTGTWVVCGWDECTAECGGSTVGGMIGVQSRKVRCVDNFDSTKVVDNFFCSDEDYPGDRLLGCKAEKCEGSNWMTTVWSSCDADTKIRVRTSHCHDSKSRTVRNSVCDASTKPYKEEKCMPNECPLQIVVDSDLSMATRHHGLGVVATILTLFIAFTNAC